MHGPDIASEMEMGGASERRSCPAWLEALPAPALRMAAVMGCAGAWVAIGWGVYALVGA